MGLYAARGAVLTGAQLGLSDRAARLLVHMALECWDDERNPLGFPARHYFGRPELAAIALGHLAPANGEDPALTEVAETIRELLEAGAIVPASEPLQARREEFELLVDSTRPPRAVALGPAEAGR